jgi:hypothetical protein
MKTKEKPKKQKIRIHDFVVQVPLSKSECTFFRSEL